ncbi:aminoglycoside resistance protein [Paenarthrobacter sp. Z7-10]|uniref:aminoglycoside phosphotransferase family protein n=1 Tax=Paenarthrobacter sp. Z7-10 TaxID=2787635 RepID=UPI0022A9CB82|nr:aminoglycoside phosphotransferase family protein [Paenarthrobacter sp. Z7-10]MCZ2404983.1 aminoglycoside resistance protein [Paenarthrobacter sp. Z7-10]
MPAAVPIPADLQRRYGNSSERRAWLAGLPALVSECLQRWNLRVTLAPGQEPWNGSAGIVVPVLDDDGAPAVLKVAFPYAETLLEPVALRLWAGNGAVRLLHADEQRCAMVLERMDAGRWLHSVPMDEATAVWGSLVRQLSLVPDDRPDWAALPHIAETAERWSDDLPAEWERLGRPFDRWLLETALEVCQTRGAVGRRVAKDVLVHSDLHYMNILGRSGTDDYAAIDPQPTIGEAEFGVAPCLWNRIPDLSRTDPQPALRARCAELSSAAGLDGELARQWSIAREVDNALWYFSKPGHGGDAARSLWVASTLAGRTLDGLPTAHQLKTL